MGEPNDDFRFVIDLGGGPMKVLAEVPAKPDPSFKLVAMNSVDSATNAPAKPAPASEVGLNSEVPAGAAARMRLTRLRRREGYRCLTIELHRNEIDALVTRGFLRSESCDDRWELAEALYRLFEKELVSRNR